MRILMIIDGSPHAEAGLRLGVQLARRVSQPSTVMTVIKHEAERPSADAILARASELLKTEVSDIRTKVALGDPVEEIIREARDGRYDLVAVSGRLDHSLISQLLPNSTAVRVAERAPCSVILTKSEAGPVRRIVLCDSGAERPSALSRFTAQLADLLQDVEEVTVLHVMSQMSAGPGVKGRQLRADADELITEHAPEGELFKRDIKLLEQVGVHARPKVRHGLVVDEILKDVQSEGYDLVVLGAHRNEGWQRILLDDLAHKIMMQLDRPVLIVR